MVNFAGSVCRWLERAPYTSMVPVGARLRGNLSAKFPGNTIYRSFNALARGQFLQACGEIRFFCADYFIASEVAYDCFLLAPPVDVDCLESIMLRQLKHQLPDAGCSRRL